MSIFERIKEAIFGSSAKAETQTPVGAPPASQPPAKPSVPTPSAGTAPTAGTSPSFGTVDVVAILDGLNAQRKKKLNWRQSIVDLMKLLGLDSGLAARRKLATELNYSGDMKKTAPMNIWLHKQVMVKLAENGGKVPDDLKR